jgi:nudix-type nucleoside diphosphatase (YffH/AdpP family)
MKSRIKNLKSENLSEYWGTLSKVSYEYQGNDGNWETQYRESYNHGNGASILLYNPETGKIILTRQFRLPAYLNGSQDGLLLEACAGLLDNDNPEDCIRKETEEETGYRVKNVIKIFESYMSPGSLTELLHLFVAEYNNEMKVSEGGGNKGEQENIEVLELDFEEAYSMIATGQIRDGKTIMLLQYAKIEKLLE